MNGDDAYTQQYGRGRPRARVDNEMHQHISTSRSRSTSINRGGYGGRITNAGSDSDFASDSEHLNVNVIRNINNNDSYNHNNNGIGNVSSDDSNSEPTYPQVPRSGFASALYNDVNYNDHDLDDIVDPNKLASNTSPTTPMIYDNVLYDDIANFDDGEGDYGPTVHTQKSKTTNGNKKQTKKQRSKKKIVSGGHDQHTLSTARSSADRHRGDTPSTSNTAQMQLRQVSLKELIATLSSDQTDISKLHPTLERRVRDFRFAQRKRREKYGSQKRWGVFGLYQHLADIRLDLEWAEDAAWRRNHMEPYLRWTDYEIARSKGMNRPFFTIITIVICTIMLLVTIGLNGWKLEPLSVNPLLGPSAQVLIDAGARETSLIVTQNQWFRLFSPLILHAGIVHYVINMMALYFIGAAVEQSHGFVSSAVLFIVPAVGGNILSAIFLPQYISVGASGGIFGLIGACIADIVLNWNLLFIKSDEDGVNQKLKHTGALVWLLMDIILNCLIGLTPFVDNFTHLGGLFYGFCCGLSTIERVGVGFFGVIVTTGKWSKIRNDLMRFCGLIFSVIMIMVTTALLIDSDGSSSPCPKCRYISCVPFPFWVPSHQKWWNCDDCDFAVADLVKLTKENVFYDRIDLTCPDGDISIIDITDAQESDREVIRRKLPSYCRQYCEDLYLN